MSLLQPRSRVLCFTGHRPDKLGGYGDAGAQCRSLVQSLLSRSLIELRSQVPDLVVISGMAQGVDTLGALAALELEIPVIAAVPCVGQEKPWPFAAQQLYHSILERCAEVHVLAACYSPSVMQARNIWMVDHSSFVLAIHDGSPGGTANCVRYAETAAHAPRVRVLPVPGR